jgi:hypothetical protein
VIGFLERMARTNVMQKDYLLESAAAIRRGQMPSWYQRTNAASTHELSAGDDSPLRNHAVTGIEPG